MTTTYANEEKNQVTSNKGSENSQISPPVVKVEAQCRIKLVADGIRAVRAFTSGIVHNVSRSHVRKVALHVITTALAEWCSKGVQLASRASNRTIVQFCDDHTTNHTREGVELVQPSAPEARDLGLWDGDTAEEGEDNDYERVHYYRSVSKMYWYDNARVDLHSIAMNVLGVTAESICPSVTEKTSQIRMMRN